MPRGKEHRYETHVTWTGAAAGGTKSYQDYSREYRAEFPGKPSLTGSADPGFIGLGQNATIMLSYVAVAALVGLEVIAYEDETCGTMQQEGRGGRFTEVVLRPRVTLAAGSDVARGEALHEEAHRTCFIANSVNFPVRHEAETVVA